MAKKRARKSVKRKSTTRKSGKKLKSRKKNVIPMAVLKKRYVRLGRIIQSRGGQYE